MTLPPVFGHEALLDRLEAAIASGRFPQVVMLAGPAGVGKQRIALRVAQALLCSVAQAGPCGGCEDCRLAQGLAHPDLHWFVPVPRPKAQDSAKQVEEVRELLGEAVAERRSQPLYQRPDGTHGHWLASVRLLQRVASLTPFRARRKIILLGDAERLVVQEASQEAANALLKVLEEPPADTVMLLTVAEPQALLPTIRSRVVPIRVGRVTDAAVRDFLTSVPEPHLDTATVNRRVALANGVIGRVVWGDDQATAKAEEEAGRFLASVDQGAGAWAERALAQTPWAARGAYADMLDQLAVQLGRNLADDSRGGNVPRARARAAQLRAVESARAEVRGNVNPQLTLAALALELERLT